MLSECFLFIIQYYYYSISYPLKVLVALRWFAKGGMLSETAQLHGVSKATASRCIKKVASYLTSIAGQHIFFPRGRWVHNVQWAGCNPINSFWLSQLRCMTIQNLVSADELGHHWLWVMACCLTAPSHYPNQYWLFAFKRLSQTSRLMVLWVMNHYSRY